MTKSEKIAAYVARFRSDGDQKCAQGVDNAHAAEWMEKNIPFFECPDKELEEVYYYRWWVYRRHLKQTPEGYIVTEFLPDVPWAGPYNSISCACGHHAAEGRWIRDTRYLADYFRFWLSNKGDTHAYSNWLAWSLMQWCKTTGDIDFGIGLLGELVGYYETWEKTNLHPCGLFWSNDDRDGMECSISGAGFRPTLNAYMAANAQAIVWFAQKAGREDLAQRFSGKAARLRRLINTVLWDEKDGFFKCIPAAGPRAEKPETDFARIPPEHNVIEEIGLIPWYFDLADADKDGAWRYLTDGRRLMAPFGPTTADQSHPRYRFSFAHECLWNGPSWPFATTQTLSAAATFLAGGGGDTFTAADYRTLLGTYARSHHRLREDGRRVLWIDEDLDPFTGEWIARDILKSQGWPAAMGGFERGRDYNHSAFCDLIIGGLCGVRETERPELRLHPLVDAKKWRSFRLCDLPYHGRTVDIVYDLDGPRGERGFSIRVDGVRRFYADALCDAVVPL